MNNSRSLGQILSSLPHLFGIHNETNESEYAVLLKEKKCELREYASYIVAETLVKGEDHSEAIETGYMRLANYIFRKNATETNIPMTSPMLQSKGDGGWNVSFIIPSHYDLSSAPKPLDSNIGLKESPARLMAAIRFKGSASQEKIDLKTAELTTWLLSKNQYQITSAPIAAQYDPPSTLPFLRRNEVLIEVSKDLYH